jgi:hypothetical protein
MNSLGYMRTRSVLVQLIEVYARCLRLMFRNSEGFPQPYKNATEPLISGIEPVGDQIKESFPQEWLMELIDAL